MNESNELTEARRQGRLEAETFDLRLRAIETREREDRFVHLVAERSDLSTVGTPAARGDTALIERLKRDIEHLSAFQRAVMRSRGWRLVQLSRSLFGRAW